MREIAFRIWDVKNKRMNNGGFWVGGMSGSVALVQGVVHGKKVFSGVLQREKDFILMQFTGLKDKNGKEIWEGDIVQNLSGRMCKIVWNEFAACFDAEVVKEYPNDNPDGFVAAQWSLWVKIIGNIHQNPELLNG